MNYCILDEWQSWVLVSRLTGCWGGGYYSFLIHCMVPENSEGSWQRMVNYHKLKQVGALAAATVPNVISLLQKVKIASSSWNTAIDLVNAFFSIPIMKEDQKKFRFTWEWEEYMFIYSYAPGLWCFPSFDSLDIPKDRKLIQHTNVIMLARTV